MQKSQAIIIISVKFYGSPTVGEHNHIPFEMDIVKFLQKRQNAFLQSAYGRRLY